MKKSHLQETAMEVTVGAFLLMILLALGFVTIILSRENIFVKSYRLDVVFEDVTGLIKGDKTYVHGVDVGRVKEMKIKPDGVHIVLSLQHHVVLYKDYRISVEPSSVLGGRYVAIDPGSPEEPPLAPGEVIRGVPPVDFIGEATETIKQVRHALEEGGVLGNVTQTMANVREITDKLRKGEGTIGKLLNDDQVYNDLRSVSTNLQVISQRLADGKGTLGKLMSEDDTLYTNLTAAANAFKDIADGVNRGEGTLGKLTKDDEVYKQLTKLLTDLRAAVDDFRETAPITSFSSIFFGAF